VTVVDFDRIDRDLKASFATPFSSSITGSISVEEYLGYSVAFSD